MSNKVTVGWLQDDNGNRFAPKTLTSLVQTPEGILLEDKIQQDVENKITTALNSTKEYTDNKIADLVNSAPETLDTLGELAEAFEENAEVVEVLNEAITNKADKTYVDEQIAAIPEPEMEIISTDEIDALCVFDDVIEEEPTNWRLSL